MVTRLLNLCGLYLGPEEKMVSSTRGNPFGHWENLEILKINEAVLSHFKGTWDNPPDFPDRWAENTDLDVMFKEAEGVISPFWSVGKVWGWKEPRTTLLVPFWRKIIPNIKFVVMIRDPLSVALSLQKRDGIPLREGCRLWHTYMIKAIQDTEKEERIFTFYDDYFLNPLSELKRLVEFCQLNPTEDLSNLIKAIDQESSKRQIGLEDFLGREEISGEIKLFYLGLLSSVKSMAFSTTNREAGDQEGRISKNVHKFLETAMKISNQLDLLEKKKNDEKEIPIWAGELKETLLQQKKSLQEKNEWIAELQSTVQDLEKHISLRDQQLLETQDVLNETCKNLYQIRNSKIWRYTAPLRRFILWLEQFTPFVSRSKNP